MKKTNKIISILLVLAMMLTMAPLTAFARNEPSTVEIGGITYYKIRNAIELDWFANQVNNGNGSINAALANDIVYNSGTMSASTTGANVWTPIGSRENPFTGIFNGQGYTISGLYSKDPTENPYLALVACSVDATIANVAVTNFYFESRYGLCAGLVSYSAGTTIYNCYAQGSIYAKDAGGAAGGICASVFGHNKTEILNCLADVSLKVDDPSDFSVIGPNVRNYIGGIICMGDKNNPVMVQKSIYITDRYSGSLYSQYALPADFTIYDSEGMPASKLATGEIAYILGDGWGQKLGTDPIPEIGNENRVDYGYESCDANAQKVFTNYATNPNYPDHYDSETDGDVVCDFCGENLHIHSFEYTANGNVITATCSNSDGNCPDTNGGTLTISAPADLYTDGRTVKEAVIDNQLVEAADYTVSYLTSDGSAPTTEGTYTASVTVGGATASVEFTLLNYAAKVTDKDGNEIEGSPFKTLEEAADAVTWDYENATITLLDDITLDSTWSVGGVVTIDLNGKTLNCTSGDTIFVQAFNGFAVTVVDSSENKTGVIRSETGLAIDVGVGSKFILNSGTITAENDYAIMAAYRERNHSLLEINGGTVNGVVLCYADSVVSGGTFNDVFAISYNYKQNKFSGGIFNGGIKITSFDPLNDLLADGYHFRNAQGKVVDGSSEIIEEKVTIEKGADFSADAVVTAEDVVYNGAAQEPDVTVTIGGKILTEGKDYTIAFADNINAGTATVTVTSAGDYEGEIVKTFEIKKADSSIDVYPEANKLTYNGEAQTLVVIGDTCDGMIVYSLDGEKYSLLPPTGTNAGKYTVYYKVEGDGNHNDSEPETVIATIEKKAVSVSATVPDRIYGDDYQVDTSKVVVTFDGIVEGDDVGYVVIDACYYVHTVTDNAPVQVVYNVNGADADNYQFPEYGEWLPPYYCVEAAGRVLPRDIADAEIILGDALIYNGTEQTQSIASVTVIGKDVTYDAINNTATNVGVYELTITGNGNFTGTKTALFEVAPDTNAIDTLTVDNVKSTDKKAIEAVAKQIENAVTDLASDEKKAEYKAIADKCNELLAKIDATADEIARIDEAVNSYDIETVTSADIPALGKLIEDIKAITDGDNLTEDEKAALEANGEAIDELAEKLTEVAEEIKRVDEAVKSYDEDSVKSTDKADLDQLKADIQALIDSTNTAENEKAAFEDMIKNIEGLEDKVEEIENQLEEIKGFENDYNPETVTSDDKAAIEEKIAEIEAVNPDNLTDEQKAEYDEIKAGFEALLEEIEKAGSEVDSIGAELEAIDEKRVAVFWKDEIEALKAKIDELLTNDNMGEAEKARLNEYKAQCDNLIEIINTPVKYFSMRLFYLVWDALNWLVNYLFSLFK